MWASEIFGLTSSHPAGKDESGNPKRNLWRPPEGTAAPPPEENNPLFKLLMDISSSQESLLEDHLLLTNLFFFFFFIYLYFFTSNKVKVHRVLVFMHTHSLTHLLTY